MCSRRDNLRNATHQIATSVAIINAKGNVRGGIGSRPRPKHAALNIVEFEWCRLVAGHGDSSRTARRVSPRLVVGACGLYVAHPVSFSELPRPTRELSLQLIEHVRHRTLHLQGLLDFISAEERILAVFK